MPDTHTPIPVAVLILPSVVLFDFSVPMQIFGYPRPDAGLKRYTTTVCTARPGRVRSSSGDTLLVSQGLSALRTAHTIVLPGIDDLERPIPPAVGVALRAAAARGARFVTICTGAFVLAEAGLLNDRPAATHWMDAPLLQSRYPRVQVQPDVLFVDDGDMLSSAGIACGLDLCLHVVREDYGADVAAAVSRRMVAAPRREGSQAQFVPRMPVDEPSDVAKTIAWARTKLGQPITVDGLAEHARMSVRTFNRRFRESMGQPPLHWLIGERVLAARELLEHSRLPLSRIAARCGFGSEVTLRLHFQQRLNVSPSAYRKQFAQRAG